MILIAGGGGFIGGHLAAALLRRGERVRVVDLKPLDEWWQVHPAADNRVLDLRHPDACAAAVTGVSQVFNLACDMGGMGFIERNKALCMLSVVIHSHLLIAARAAGVQRYFYASSACVYPAGRQDEAFPQPLREQDAYPADPEDGYGWEKLFGERLARHVYEDFGFETRVARFHNVYGPLGTWTGGREKAPAAVCRKVAEVMVGAASEIPIWGDGKQSRTFTFIDDAVEGALRLMDSDVREPINIGSDEAITIDGLVDIVEQLAGIRVPRRYQLDAPKGVRGRSSDNTLIRARLAWAPSTPLSEGMARTWAWVLAQVRQSRRQPESRVQSELRV